ncbi:hypothetical protein GMST_35600 [Geomonas silvestris]|uniref:Uncharacterized protein n=2 Tax=Geomonas silvestris TaxID=2740184 RepID=A0A6V8MMG5_9BACT|nr:hypothetical protein GMST_35600 [Geomonas silvestris]
MNSLKAAGTTKGSRHIPVTAKNAAQQRGRTGMKNASGNTARKSSTGKRGGKS